MRGRNNNNRKGPNPLSRSYESNGPDVKIRGTAHHIGEKYLQLARDAQSGGDPVMAESYLQHAEHYFRIIAAAQQAQQAQFAGYNRQGTEAEAEELEDEDDFTGMTDRFASPSERMPQNQQQPYAGQPPAQNGQPNFNGQGNYQERPQYEPRGERGDRNNNRNFQDRNGQDRSDRNDRNGQERGGQDRGGYGERSGQGGRDGGREQGRRPPFRGDNAPRYDNGGRYERHESRNANVNDDAANGSGLPAFITAPVPVRVQPEADLPAEEETVGTEVMPRPEGEGEGFAMRPRRRRRKPEFGETETKAPLEE